MERERWQHSDGELLCGLVELEERMRRDYSAMLELISELDRRNVTAERGYGSFVELLRDLLRISRNEATRRVGHARAVTEVVMPSGATVAAPLLRTAAAMRAGALGAEHLDVIVKALTGLPADTVAWGEEILVDAARTLDARAVARVGRELRARVDQDGSPPTDAELANPVNELRFSTRASGRTAFRGELEPEASALLQALLSPLAKPRPSSESGPDPRSATERNGDALVEILHLAAGSNGAAGERPHVMVTVPLQTLAQHSGSAMLDGGAYLTAEAARRIACDAKAIPVVLGSASEPLDIGRASHTVPTAMRRALVLRDGGCAFPGCDRPHRWCHAHHVEHWGDGGATALDNLVLLCGRHHRLVHHSEWECEVIGGRAVFRPPEFFDSRRRPRVNPQGPHRMGTRSAQRAQPRSAA